MKEPVDKALAEAYFRTKHADPPGTDYSQFDKIFGPPKKEEVKAPQSNDLFSQMFDAKPVHSRDDDIFE